MVVSHGTPACRRWQAKTANVRRSFSKFDFNVGGAINDIRASQSNDDNTNTYGTGTNTNPFDDLLGGTGRNEWDGIEHLYESTGFGNKDDPTTGIQNTNIYEAGSHSNLFDDSFSTSFNHHPGPSSGQHLRNARL